MSILYTMMLSVHVYGNRMDGLSNEYFTSTAQVTIHLFHISFTKGYIIYSMKSTQFLHKSRCFRYLRTVQDLSQGRACCSVAAL